jgi:hypothetical protein
LTVIRPQLLDSFVRAALSPDPNLAVAALIIARIEHPALDAGLYLDRLDALGSEARRRVALAPVTPGGAPPDVDPTTTPASSRSTTTCSASCASSATPCCEDPRNSFLNDVLDRRTGFQSRWLCSTSKSPGAPACAWKGSITRAFPAAMSRHRTTPHHSRI